MIDSTAPTATGPTPRGFIVFCESTLRYVGGPRAWVFPGLYVAGACLFERLIATNPHGATTGVWPWIGFLAYLLLFPLAYKRLSRIFARKKS